MKINTSFGSGMNTRVVILVVLIILLPFAYSLVSYVLAQGGQSAQPFLERPDEQYKECVKETRYMRFHHWELLRGIREEVVRYGSRGDIGLSGCKKCHTSRERFCNKCHDAVSMTPDCFECHYYP